MLILLNFVQLVRPAWWTHEFVTLYVTLALHSVTYSGFSIHDGTLLRSRSQYTTVKHSQQLLEHTYASDPHGFGTHTPIEFFQQDLLWLSSNTPIPAVRKLPNTPGQDNPSSGYRSTCTLQRHLSVYIINPPFTSPDDRMSSLSTVALRITSNLYSFSDPTHNFMRSPSAILYMYTHLLPDGIQPIKKQRFIPTGYRLLLLGCVERSVPSTAAIFWRIVRPNLSSNIITALTAPETSSSDSRRRREMCLNFADVASQSYYARIFNML
jgi:hypothetical protein